MTGQFDAAIEQLNDETLAALRREDLSVMHLAHAIPALESIRRDLHAANLTAPEDLPNNQVSTARQVISNQLPTLLQRMSEWNPAEDNNAAGSRNSFMQEAQSIRDTIAIHLRPYVRPDLSRIDESAQRLAGLEHGLQRIIHEATDTITTVDRTTQELRTQAVQTGASRVSGYYKTAEEGHRKNAKRYLIATGSFALILIATVLFTFKQSTAVMAAGGLPGVIQSLAARILVLLVLTAAVAFCARNYRINKHLEVLNHTRYNALETFQLFVSGVTEDARNIVVSELVRAVFSPGDTGYMNTDREQMIIDNPGSALGFLSAKQG